MFAQSSAMATASLGPWPALPSCTTMGSPTILDDILTTMVTSVTGGIARVFMTRLNTTRVGNGNGPSFAQSLNGVAVG